MARHRRNEAAVRHWWRAFLFAQTSEDAYAAWVLFLQTCDWRSFGLLRRDVTASNDGSDLFEREMGHAEINRSLIKRQSESRDKDLDNTFLDRRIVNGVGP